MSENSLVKHQNVSDDSLIDKLTEYFNSKTIKFAKLNERPWGSWELHMKAEYRTDGKSIVCGVFGFAFSMEDAATLFFTNLYEQKLDYNHMVAIREYLGNSFVDEINKIIESHVSEHIRQPEN